MTSMQINAAAFAEGWGIFLANHNSFEIQKLDEEATFGSDDDAIKHVCNNAIESPKSIHAEAIIFIAENAPKEISVIKSIITGDEFTKLKSALKHTSIDNF